ncbi:DUF6894 family protein [uncultured Methylobacterium sp.]|uniref:DUF6894 family protein n=1 Tax=uncultured Methylobacterium sp. TaxID=157278 RepID=UPI0035CBF118
MVRFHIDSDDGDLLVHDEEGQDYADAQAARDVALASLPDMAKCGIGRGGRRTFSVRVRDESGATVYSASLRLEDEWSVEPPLSYTGGP